jgi:hypothetical protein
LGEQLWAPELKAASIQSNLDYLVYQGKAERQTMFWIASDGSHDRVIDAAGYVSYVSAKLRLLALCTQSAPYSNKSYMDTDEKWQISVHSNSQDIIGLEYVLVT